MENLKVHYLNETENSILEDLLERFTSVIVKLDKLEKDLLDVLKQIKDLEVKASGLEKTKAELFKIRDELRKEEIDFYKSLHKKYGEGFIDIEQRAWVIKIKHGN